MSFRVEVIKCHGINSFVIEITGVVQLIVLSACHQGSHQKSYKGNKCFFHSVINCNYVFNDLDVYFNCYGACYAFSF